MDKELIKKLSKAGVSSDVILALMLDDDDQKPEQPKPEPAPKLEPKHEPAPQTAAIGNDAILAAIEKLTGAVQAANIRSMSAGDPPVAETADDILASIISPKKGGK